MLEKSNFLKNFCAVLAIMTLFLCAPDTSFASNTTYSINPPSIVKVREYGDSKLKVCWNTSPGAIKYIVYQRTAGKSYKRVKVTTSKSYVTKTLSRDKTYYFTVKAVKAYKKYSAKSIDAYARTRASYKNNVYPSFDPGHGEQYIILNKVNRIDISKYITLLKESNGKPTSNKVSSRIRYDVRGNNADRFKISSSGVLSLNDNNPLNQNYIDMKYYDSGTYVIIFSHSCNKYKKIKIGVKFESPGDTYDATQKVSGNNYYYVTWALANRDKDYDLRCQIDDVVESTSNMSDSQKAAYISRYVEDTVTYSKSFAESNNDGYSYGVLFTNKGVCAGYTAAYDLLARNAGLEVAFSTNSNHSVNMVKINGVWKVVDSTFNDTGNTHKYTLMDKDEYQEAFNESYNTNDPFTFFTYSDYYDTYNPDYWIYK